MITRLQIRMARTALRWGVRDLGRHAGVAANTVSRFENGMGTTVATLGQIQRAFESNGRGDRKQDPGHASARPCGRDRRQAMISVEQLAEIVARKEQLKRIGRERWAGLCPFHQEKSPSFHIYKGRSGASRWHCFGCGADGDGVDWLRKAEHKTYREAGGLKPDPQIQRARERQKRRTLAIKEFRDRHPDSTIPDELLLVDL